MKKIKFFCSILILVCILFACNNFTSKQKKYAIKINGSNNIKFQGSYIVTNQKGESKSKSVEGVVPVQYETEPCWIVSCTFQKKSENGSLGVVIIDEDGKVTSESTDAAYGVVSLSTSN